METNEGQDDAAKGGAAAAASGAASSPAKEESMAAQEMIGEGAPAIAPASAEPTKDEGDKTDKPAEAAAATETQAPADVAATEKKEGDEKAADKPKAAAAVVPAPPPISGNSAGIIALCIIVGAVLVSIFIMRRQEPSAGAGRNNGSGQAQRAPKEEPWKVGQKVPVTITVLPDDAENLACASSQEVAGRHCGFESKDTAWSKGENTDDKVLLRPFATTGKRRIIAAGFWTAIKTPLPDKRFTAQCTFDVEGKLDKPSVRFKKGTPFREVHDSWAVGTLSDCTVQAPK